MILIGVTGKKFHGKTSVVRHLVEKYGFYSINFSDKLKSTVSELWDIPRHTLESPKLKEVLDKRYGFSPREIMQLFGTEVARQITPKIWIYQVERELKRWKDENSVRIVIGDVRFINEASMIKSLGGTIFKVLREDFLDEKHINHQSEREIDSIKEDFLLFAKSGEVSKLHEQIDSIVDENYTK